MWASASLLYYASESTQHRISKSLSCFPSKDAMIHYVQRETKIAIYDIEIVKSTNYIM